MFTFCFLAGIFRQRSQLIGLLDKNSNICSAALCRKRCQGRLQRKIRSNPKQPSSWMQLWQTEICVYLQVMCPRWRHIKRASTRGWLLWASPHKTHTGKAEPAAMWPKLQRLRVDPLDSQTGSTIHSVCWAAIIRCATPWSRCSFNIPMQKADYSSSALSSLTAKLQNTQRQPPHQPDKYSCSSVKLKHCQYLASTNGAAEAELSFNVLWKFIHRHCVSVVYELESVFVSTNKHTGESESITCRSQKRRF